MTARARAAALVPLLLSGCAGIQNSLGGEGADGRRFITLFAIFLAVCALAYLLVIGFLLGAMFRRRRLGEELTADTAAHESSPPAMHSLLIGWIGFVAVGLAVLTVASFLTDRGMAQTAARPALQVEVTAHQWWWDVRYIGSEPFQELHTANELHLPVGVPVHVTLKSNDVIHSLWIPNLAGKQDLIPGRLTDLTLLPRRTGLYRAQCAEFCGVQHAHMALDVTVEDKASFARWWNAGLQPAQPPRTPLAAAGYAYVTTRQCAMCHTVGGTPATGKVAPDLTHLASRRSIAAGTLPMSRGNLYGWVADPQSQKPGTHMPVLRLQPGELHAVVAYLEGLK
jgi:cytochrome c oxidase subunit 2